MKDVVKCSVFLRDGGDFGAMNEVYAEFFGDAKPARTTVETKFADPTMKVEISPKVDEKQHGGCYLILTRPYKMRGRYSP